MIIDTHTHLDDKQFTEDLPELLLEFKKNNIGMVINSGASFRGVIDTIALMDRYPLIYGSLGIHPDNTDELNEDRFLELKEYCSHEKCVGIGEIGLDYHYDNTDKPTQKKWFIRQLELAEQIKKPVIIHSRDAAKDTMDILHDMHAEKIGGVMHCYSYSLEIAKELLDMNFHFGIGGVVTFKNAKKLKEVVEYIPLESILLETDSPYLAPEPYRGRRNSPLYLTYVIEEIARIKGISAKEVEAQTEKNVKRLYFNEM